MIRISVAKSSCALRSGGATISLSRDVPANSRVKRSPSTSSRALEALTRAALAEPAQVERQVGVGVGLGGARGLSGLLEPTPFGITG